MTFSTARPAGWPYAHAPGAKQEMTEACREWFEQALIETVLGVQSLKDSPRWTIEDYSKSPVGGGPDGGRDASLPD